MLDIHGTPALDQPSRKVGAWPLSSALELGALPSAVPCARLHTRSIVYEWGITGLAETAELVVSELVTNALLATTEVDGRPKYEANASLPVVHLRLSSDHVRLVVEVWDLSPEPPEAKQPEPDAETGRGLVLVEALSQRWGWERVPGWGGKMVWTELRLQ
jgi:anti-sigma regulatory factor (Ser/Thr protein kinase)